MDIILLLFLAFKISKLAAQKGETKSRWVIMLVLAWVSGEIIGGSIGLVIFGKNNLFSIALLALGFAGTFYFKIEDYLKSKPDVNKDDINNIGK